MGYFQIEITDSARREIRQLPGNTAIPNLKKGLSAWVEL